MGSETEAEEVVVRSGMMRRQIKGANGSLYTANSDAAHLALSQLWDLLKEIGFKLSRKSDREATIQAYLVKYRQYPILNPRFSQTKVGFKECLDFTVLSKGDRTILDRQLGQFESTQECAFISTFDSISGYHCHGNFILPLRFIGSATDSEIDFGPLRQPLGKMLHFLAGTV